MSSIFEMNMSVLEQRFPHVHSAVTGYSKNLKNQLQLCKEETRNGLLNLKVTTDSSNFFLHSAYDPYNEAQTLFRVHDIDNKDTLLILGFGMGYHIEELIKKYPNKNKLIIEPSLEIFYRVINERDIAHILKGKNIQLITSESAALIYRELYALYDLGYINSVEFLAMPSYQRLYQKFWDEVKRQYAKYIRVFHVNVRTILSCTYTWINNFFYNLANMSQSVDLNEYVGKFAGVPAIIVSAGPSLNKNIALLKEVQDKALIIAAGSSINVLQKEGIRPHVMLGIDGSSFTSKVYNNVEWKDILFAYTLNLHYECLDEYTGPKMFLKTHSVKHNEWMEQCISHLTPPLSSGGSCANVCLSFVKLLGCNPVIFIGQDLAFTNMQSHAEGRLDKKAINESSLDTSKFIKTKDIYGQDIYTVDVFLTMAYGLENFIETQSTEHVFINATEGGLPLRGTRSLTLREALDKYCSEDCCVSDRLEELYDIGSNKNIGLHRKLIDFAEMILKEVKEVSELSNKRLRLIDKILKAIEKNDLASIGKLKNRLFKLTERIEKNILFQQFIYPGCHEIMLIYKNSTEAEAEKVEKIQDKMKVLYGGLRRQYGIIIENNGIIKKAAEEALQRLEEGGNSYGKRAIGAGNSN